MSIAKSLSLVEKLVGVVAIIVSSYYILHGITAFSSLDVVTHIQGNILSKISFIMDMLINSYLLPLAIFISGLLYVNNKIGKIALLFILITFLLLAIVIVIQYVNIKSYLIMIVINCLLLLSYIAHKNIMTKEETSASSV